MHYFAGAKSFSESEGKFRIDGTVTIDECELKTIKVEDCMKTSACSVKSEYDIKLEDPELTIKHEDASDACLWVHICTNCEVKGKALLMCGLYHQATK